MDIQDNQIVQHEQNSGVQNAGNAFQNNLNNPLMMEKESDFFDYQAFVRIFIGKWYFFVISVFISVSVGVIQIWRTPQAYTMQAQLLVKDQRTNSSVGLGYAFADIAGVSGLIASNVSNEMMIIRSRSVMRGVVANHGFQYHYYEPRFWRNEELYNLSPVRLVPSDPKEAQKRSTYFTLAFIKGDTEHFTYETKDTSFILPFNKEVEFPGFGKATMQVNEGAALEYMNHVNHRVIVFVASVEGAIGMYLGGLYCGPSDKKESAAINLVYTSTSAQKAADVLNAVIIEYNKQTIESKNEVLENSMAFIDARIDVVGRELQDVDERLAAFKRDERTVSPGSEAGGFLASSMGKEEEIATMEIQVRLIKELLEDLERPHDSYEMIPLNVGINNSMINNLISEYDKNLVSYRKLRAAGSDRSPSVVDKAFELDQQYNSIKTTTKDVLRSAELQLERVKNLADKNLNRMGKATGNVRALASIEREQVVKSSLYNYLLQKTEENSILKSMTEPNVRVIDSAYGSSAPVSPNKSKIMLIALLIGIVVPYVFLIAKELLYTKVRGRSDVTNQLTAPVVGEIPRKPKKLATQTFFVEEGANNQISEAFRILRTNMSFLNVGGPIQVVALTSTLSGEGKSYVACNLAMACAISGKRVCLVDVDLRKMSSSRQFKMRGKKGMSEYLANKEMDDVMALVQHTDNELVDMLPGGVIPPNPAELLTSPRFDQAIAELRKHYDYIVIDNPPLDVVADTGIANRVTDITLYVMRVGVLDRRQLPAVQEIYTTNRLKNMAIVITDVDYDALNYSIGYTGYGKYYGYRYYGHNYYNYYASTETPTDSKLSFGFYHRDKKKRK